MKNNKYLKEYLKDTERYYLSNSKKIKIKALNEQLDKADLAIYHIEEITFEEEAPRKEAFENVISALRCKGINFLYLILGNSEGVKFYFGVVKDINKKIDLEIDTIDIGNGILKPSIIGNFRGSKVNDVEVREKVEILNRISNMSHYGVLEGVPGINEEKENFQGMDRLVDVMAGDEFGISILASPFEYEEIEEIENTLYDIYDKLSPLSKNSKQESIGESINNGENRTTNTSVTNGSSESENRNESISETTGSNRSTSFGTNESKSSNGSSSSSSKGSSNGGSEGTNKSTGKTISNGKTIGTTSSKTKGNSMTIVESITKNKGENTSFEFVDKRVSKWNSYLDDVLFKRVDYGKAKGLFNTSIFLSANNPAVLMKLGNTMQALFSGINGNKVPLRLNKIENKEILNYLQNFQFPLGNLKNIDDKERGIRAVLSQKIKENETEIVIGNWVSSNELSLIAGLPQKEVVGLGLKEEVEFGLNPKNKTIKNENRIKLGNLVKSGVTSKFPVYIDRSNLDKHTFIAGVTGSGKTTTCHRILSESDVPFLVIEPAKTEYRILKNLYDDLLIFTLGNDNIAPFRLNPFEFFPHENITSRVDMIKASIESAFDMEAAIPQLIEASLYKCYEDYGWDIATNKNSKFEEPFADGIYSFPTLSNLIENTKVVAEAQGFDERLKNDYIGSIKARLQGLLVGSKGLMLNTPRSIDFKELVKKKVVLELDEIKSGAEKSLIMGFVMTNLNEAIKASHYEARKNNEKAFKHITLLEEAHRLLSKFEPGDNHSKKQGVEIFADMLAEVRKYGESLIIVDQIPNKLTPEVLKNTNTKIVHKIFARDDKEAIGNTMALEDEQKSFLSYLEVGRAIVSSQNFPKPIQVKIDQLKEISTTETKDIEEKELRRDCLKYYAKTYKKGIIFGLNKLEKQPSIEEVNEFFRFSSNKEMANKWEMLFKKFIKIDMFKSYLTDKNIIKKLEITSQYIYLIFYKNGEIEKNIMVEKISSFIKEIVKDKNKKITRTDLYYFRLVKNCRR